MGLGGLMEDQIVAEGTVAKETPQDTPVNVRTMSYEDLQKTLVQENTQEQEVKEPEEEEEQETAARVEEKKEETPEESKETEPPQENPYEAMAKELEETKKRLTEKDRFIDRQGNEIGELRKFIPAEEVARIKQTMKEEYDRIHYEQGPFAANEYMRGMEHQIQQQVQEKQKEANINKILESRARIVNDIPDFEAMINDMAESLKEEGIRDNVINAFKENPYIIEHGELRQLYRTTLARKNASALKSENEALRAEIAELKKRPDALIDKINTATKSVNGKSAGTKAPDAKIDYKNINPRRMSYQQLKEFQQANQ